MPRQHVVLDTNVIISAILFGGKPKAVMALVISGTVSCSLSRPILDELTAVLQRPKFGLSGLACLQILEQLHGICHIVSPQIPLEVITEDPDDNRILECAVSANADFIITGDPHLLRLQSFEGIRIMRPAEFLQVQHR